MPGLVPGIHALLSDLQAVKTWMARTSPAMTVGHRRMIRYDEHAEFQIARRNIEKAWIEAVLRNPDTIEKGQTRQSFFKCLPGRRVMLRVVTSAHDPDYVITAYFDRTKPCA